MPSEFSEGVLPSFTPEENAYFDNRGNQPANSSADDGEEPIDLVEGDEDDDIDLGDDEADEQEEPSKPKKQVVPIKALHKEREARKQFEAQFRQAEIERARMEERMNALLQRMQTTDPVDEKKPASFEDDPLGALMETQTRSQKLEEEMQAIRQAEKARIENEQMRQFAAHHEQQFAAKQPDYFDAVNYLKAGRLNELQTYFGLNAVQAQQIIDNDSREIIIAAARSGRSPAEMAYQIAKQRGYVPKNADPSPEIGKPSTKSLSQASGTAGGAKLTAQDILRMSPEEFQRFSEKNPKKLRQLMGG